MTAKRSFTLNFNGDIKLFEVSYSRQKPVISMFNLGGGSRLSHKPYDSIEDGFSDIQQGLLLYRKWQLYPTEPIVTELRANPVV